MKQKKHNTTSPFWKPSKKGDSITGIFEGFETTQKSICMNLSGNLVAMSTVLVAFFKPVFKKLRAGKTEITITFAGMTEKKYAGGNKARLYEVSMDGTELKQSFEGKKTSEKELTKLFG